ncbi:hypothetical protein [Acidianus sp. HS-5]|uniref:hypothetical protein n=1 Tax=Acidianus sp. HS-5 TaxID=2886040 RepID=UPI001F2DF270|nr:hypothetical protein [Acidianus sp. HS-5]BDC17213.1 hypothetical protein HS5_01030 [Acidianus sp. HS-5]
MTKLNKKVLLTLIFLSALIPVVAADVIYYYSGSITVKTTAMPIKLEVGSNGCVTGYISTTVCNDGKGCSFGYSFSSTIYITNSTYDYYYHFLKIKACKTGNVFVTNVNIGTTTKIENAWLVLQSGNTILKEFQIISDGAAYHCTAVCSLAAGNTYCVSLLIQPTNPLPNSGCNIGTIHVYLGYDVVTNGPAICLPPT